MPKAPPPITEEVTTGLIAVSDKNRLVAAPASMQKTGKLQADPRLEYVSGGVYNWSASYLRSLPFYVDDVTRDFGDDLYERMILDSKVSQCVETLKLAALAQGVTLLPAVGKDEDGYEQAVEIQAFCQGVLDNLTTPLYEILYDMLDALAFGNRVAEQIYAIEGGQLVLKTLKPKPRRAVAFVVDVYNNVAGLLGLVPGQGAPIIVDGVFGDPAKVPNLLPRAKFAVCTCRKQNADPRGRPLLRAAYNAWNLKMQLWGEYLKYLVQFAGPSLMGFTGEGAVAAGQIDAAGNPVLDTNGNQVILTPEAYLLTTLLEFRNGTAAAFPFGTKVEPLQMQGEGEPFLKAFELLNREIEQAITNQALATSEGIHQARASSETHQDVLGLVVAYAKRLLCDMLHADVLRPLVRYNYGEDAQALTPQASLSEGEAQDLPARWTALAAAGFALHPSQFPAIDAENALPPRSEDAVEDALTQMQAGIQAQSGESSHDPAQSGEDKEKPDHGA